MNKCCVVESQGSSFRNNFELTASGTSTSNIYFSGSKNKSFNKINRKVLLFNKMVYN